MYGCESWTVKKAEHWKIDAFELWCWRRLLRVPWTERRSNQSILKEISPGVHWKDWCWSWNSNTLVTSCKELSCWKRPWCWEGLGTGGGGEDRGWDGWMASPTQWAWVWVNSGSWWWTGRPGVLGFMGSQRVGHNWATELNWTSFVWGSMLALAQALGWLCLSDLSHGPKLTCSPAASHLQMFWRSRYINVQGKRNMRNTHIESLFLPIESLFKLLLLG